MARKKDITRTPPPARPHTASEHLLLDAPWIGWLAVIIPILLYINTLSYQYCLDDVTAVSKNIFVQQADFAQIFSTEYREGYSENSTGMLYRPLSLAFFAVLWHISPDNPAIFHCLNVLLYGCLVWLLWHTWRNILKKRISVSIVPVAVLLYGVHPVHTEVVANIKSLDEILAFLMCTAALHFFYVFHEKGGLNRSLLSLLFWTAALFSKESAITFLPVFPLVLYLFLQTRIADALKKSLPWTVPVFLFLWIRHLVLSQIAHPDGISTLDNVTLAAPDESGRIATACWFLVRYGIALLAPFRQYSDLGAAETQPVQITDFQAITGLLGAAFLLGMSLWTLKNRENRWTLPAFGILFFAATFSLSSNLIFPIGTSYGERLLFTPSWGFCLTLASLIFFWINNPMLREILVAVLVVLGSWKTIVRNPAWENSLTLCSTDLKQAPKSARLNFHYAIEMAKMNEKAVEQGVAPDPQRYRTAIEYCNRALQWYPSFYKVKETRGLAYYALGEKDRALPDLLDFLNREPLNQQLPPKIARIYFEQGNSPAAIAVLQKSIAAGVHTYDNFLFLGIIYFKNNQLHEALNAFRMAQQLRPGESSVQQHIQRIEAALSRSPTMQGDIQASNN